MIRPHKMQTMLEKDEIKLYNVPIKGKGLHPDEKQI